VPEASIRNAALPALPPIDPLRFTLRQRIVLRIIIWLGYGIIRLIGPTLRVAVSYEDSAQTTLDQRPLIASFWHSCMIPATYIFRDMGIRVMSSDSYDGQYMGRIIHKFGFLAVKGSSSRNAVRALLGLRRALEEGWTVAFTLDGPRGPRHKVKPGITGLAQINGARGETSQLEEMEMRIHLDLDYLRHWSPALDLKIMVMTLVRVFGDDKAY